MLPKNWPLYVGILPRGWRRGWRLCRAVCGADERWDSSPTPAPETASESPSEDRETVAAKRTHPATIPWSRRRAFLACFDGCLGIGKSIAECALFCLEGEGDEDENSVSEEPCVEECLTGGIAAEECEEMCTEGYPEGEACMEECMEEGHSLEMCEECWETEAGEEGRPAWRCEGNRATRRM